MTDVNTLSTDHSRAVADGAHSHGTVKPQGSRADRLTSFDLADFELPNGREEDWRFTPVKRLAGLFSEKYDDVEPIARELPMEYALELNRLIELQMEGAVG